MVRWNICLLVFLLFNYSIIGVPIYRKMRVSWCKMYCKVTWSTAPAELSPLLTAAICSSSNNLDKITRFSQIWDDYHIMKSTIINYLTYWSNSLDKITRFNQIWDNYHITKSTIIDNFTYRIIICSNNSLNKITRFETIILLNPQLSIILHIGATA